MGRRKIETRRRRLALTVRNTLNTVWNNSEKRKVN